MDAFSLFVYQKFILQIFIYIEDMFCLTLKLLIDFSRVFCTMRVTALIQGKISKSVHLGQRLDFNTCVSKEQMRSILVFQNVIVSSQKIPRPSHSAFRTELTERDT